MSWWPHVRAGLVVLHVVAITLVALPAPVGGMDRRLWADPTVQAEFRAWRGRLAAVGLELSAQEFEDRLFDAAAGLMDAREAVIAPFVPYYDHCGTWQSWRMFVAPHTHPSRLVVEVQRDGAWEEVFRERSSTATWMRPILAQDRLRSAIFRYSWANFKGSYKRFARWVSERALADHPGAQAARVRYERQASPTPEQARAGVEPEISSAQVFVLKAADL
jgi:hypothetical protein